MDTGVVVLVLTVVAVVGFGLYRGATDGRFRGTHPVRGAEETGSKASGNVLEGEPWDDQRGADATLLQFSSAFCAPCRATRHVLGDVAASHPGVSHIEVDAEHHLDLVRRLGILRTPTTLVLGPDGREVTRAAGAPTRQQVLDTLAELARRNG